MGTLGGEGLAPELFLCLVREGTGGHCPKLHASTPGLASLLWGCLSIRAFHGTITSGSCAVCVSVP